MSMACRLSRTFLRKTTRGQHFNSVASSAFAIISFFLCSLFRMSSHSSLTRSKSCLTRRSSFLCSIISLKSSAAFRAIMFFSLISLAVGWSFFFFFCLL